jgi:hypothetical protein
MTFRRLETWPLARWSVGLVAAATALLAQAAEPVLCPADMEFIPGSAGRPGTRAALAFCIDRDEAAGTDPAPAGTRCQERGRRLPTAEEQARAAAKGVGKADSAGLRCALDTEDPKAEAAMRACAARADLLFVRKCVQACMIDSKSRTRVFQETLGRVECQVNCGHQPEMISFVQSCTARAGYPDYRSPRRADSGSQ